MVVTKKIKYDRVIGIDLGNGIVKIRSVYKDGKKYRLAIPSVYAFQDEVGEDVHNKKLESLRTYNLGNATDYVWGEDIKELKRVITTTGQEGRYVSLNFNVMAKIAMARVVEDLGILPTEKILIVTGVPSDETNTMCEEQIAKAFKGEDETQGIHVVTVTSGGEEKELIFKVSHVEVMGQAVSAVINRYLDDEGYVLDEDYENMKVAVVDIGAGTTDLDIVDCLRRYGTYKSVPSGFTEIYRYMDKAIKVEYPQHEVPDHILKDCLKDKKYSPTKAKGKNSERRKAVDLEEAYEQGLTKLLTKIQQGIIKVWSDQTDIDEMLLIGASADDFKEKLEHLISGITVPENPEYANADGYFKSGMNIVLDMNE